MIRRIAASAALTIAVLASVPAAEASEKAQGMDGRQRTTLRVHDGASDPRPSGSSWAFDTVIGNRTYVAAFAPSRAVVKIHTWVVGDVVELVGHQTGHYLVTSNDFAPTGSIFVQTEGPDGVIDRLTLRSID